MFTEGKVLCPRCFGLGWTRPRGEKILKGMLCMPILLNGQLVIEKRHAQDARRSYGTY